MALAILAAGLGGQGAAQTPADDSLTVTGAQLYAICGEKQKAKDHDANRGACQGFIMATAQTLQALEFAYVEMQKARKLPQRPLACVPPDLTRVKLQAAVTGYMADHPDLQAETAEGVVIDSLVALYPCA